MTLLSVVMASNYQEIVFPTCNYSDNLLPYVTDPGADAPPPIVILRSVKVCPAPNNTIIGKLRIDRVPGYTYSDTVRIWMCPANNWDGFLCSSGQFLASKTIDTTETEFEIISSPQTFADGQKIILFAVSFRNGAEVSGFTLMYTISGVVTIGGIATTLPTLAGIPESDKELDFILS